MKQHTLIYLKDWPQLNEIYNDWIKARHQRPWFKRLFNPRDPATENKFEIIFAEEVRRVVHRNIPIGRNPRDYEWDYHNSLKAITWGEK